MPALTDAAAAPRTRPELCSQLARMRPSGIELTSDHKRLRLEWAICIIVIGVLSGVGMFGMTKLQSLSEGRLRVWMQSGDEIPGNLELLVNQSGGRLLILAAIWMNGRPELHI